MVRFRHLFFADYFGDFFGVSAPQTTLGGPSLNQMLLAQHRLCQQRDAVSQLRIGQTG
jgi:hypothetical protein